MVFRVAHRKNIPWILANGLHCANSTTKSADWVSIGNSELIDKRSRRQVPIAPFGVLNDYVPFYFTPRTPMLGNLHKGQGGVVRRSNSDLVFLVASLRTILGNQAAVFTDAHAVSSFANHYNQIEQLGQLSWEVFRSGDFRRDPEHPEQFERYQAEALVHRRCPASLLLGLACFSNAVKNELEDNVRAAELTMPVSVRTGWYFS
ncbi:MAG: DUF4433 domain-containing protein [Spirochaetales bacterium]